LARGRGRSSLTNCGRGDKWGGEVIIFKEGWLRGWGRGFNHEKAWIIGKRVTITIKPRENESPTSLLEEELNSGTQEGFTASERRFTKRRTKEDRGSFRHKRSRLMRNQEVTLKRDERYNSFTRDPAAREARDKGAIATLGG